MTLNSDLLYILVSAAFLMLAIIGYLIKSAVDDFKKSVDRLGQTIDNLDKIVRSQDRKIAIIQTTLGIRDEQD